MRSMLIATVLIATVLIVGCQGQFGWQPPTKDCADRDRDRDRDRDLDHDRDRDRDLDLDPNPLRGPRARPGGLALRPQLRGMECET